MCNIYFTYFIFSCVIFSASDFINTFFVIVFSSIIHLYIHFNRWNNPIKIIIDVYVGVKQLDSLTFRGIKCLDSHWILRRTHDKWLLNIKAGRLLWEKIIGMFVDAFYRYTNATFRYKTLYGILNFNSFVSRLIFL